MSDYTRGAINLSNDPNRQMKTNRFWHTDPLTHIIGPLTGYPMLRTPALHTPLVILIIKANLPSCLVTSHPSLYGDGSSAHLDVLPLLHPAANVLLYQHCACAKLVCPKLFKVCDLEQGSSSNSCIDAYARWGGLGVSTIECHTDCTNHVQDSMVTIVAFVENLTMHRCCSLCICT